MSCCVKLMVLFSWSTHLDFSAICSDDESSFAYGGGSGVCETSVVGFDDVCTTVMAG